MSHSSGRDPPPLPCLSRRGLQIKVTRHPGSVFMVHGFQWFCILISGPGSHVLSFSKRLAAFVVRKQAIDMWKVSRKLRRALRSERRETARAKPERWVPGSALSGQVHTRPEGRNGRSQGAADLGRKSRVHRSGRASGRRGGLRSACRGSPGHQELPNRK